MKTIINSTTVKKQINEITNIFSCEQIEEIAKLSGFVQRNTSRLTGTIFLCIFTLAMNIYQKPSMNQLLGLLKIILPDFEISREGLQQRINEHAVNFFEFMLSQAINISVKEIDLNILNHFNRVLILDSTIIELPAEMVDTFKGFGGGASESSLKIQFCYDLKSAKFFYLFQDAISPDSKYENSFVNKIEPGDLIIKDLGYFNPQAFIDISTKSAFFLSRWKSNIEMFMLDETGNLAVVETEKLLKKINSLSEFEIFIKKGKQYIKVRLVVDVVPQNVKEERLRKLEQTNKRKGRQTKELTKLYQGFNIYVSNIPAQFLAMENFRKLYSVRWQIELVFKNWKSNFNLDKISGIKAARIKCMLYSRMLLIFISTKFICQLRNIYWIETKTEISEIKASKHLIIVFQEVLKLSILKKLPQISEAFYKAIEFIEKKCTKLKQKNRTYPLDILSSL